MAMRSIISEKKDMYDLIPIIENWFIEKGYNVTVIANRIDAKKDHVAITLFLDNYPSGCLIKVYSTEKFFDNLKKYLADEHHLSYQVPCPYCKRETDVTLHNCPHCGGSLK